MKFQTILCFILVIILFFYFVICTVSMEKRIHETLDNMTTATEQRFKELENNNARVNKNVDTILCHLFPAEEGCEEK